MSSLVEYLEQKREAVLAREAGIRSGTVGALDLKANVTAEGRSGIRRIKIRDFQVITDSPPSFAGYDLGPGSPELQLGILGSCLNHSYLIQAALQQVPIDSLEIEVTGRIDPRSGRPGHETTPVYPHDIAYTVRVSSPASAAQIAQLTTAVEQACPILNLLRQPQLLKGSVEHTVSKKSEVTAA